MKVWAASTFLASAGMAIMSKKLPCPFRNGVSQADTRSYRRHAPDCCRSPEQPTATHRLPLARSEMYLGGVGNRRYRDGWRGTAPLPSSAHPAWLSGLKPRYCRAAGKHFGQRVEEGDTALFSLAMFSGEHQIPGVHPGIGPQHGLHLLGVVGIADGCPAR